MQTSGGVSLLAKNLTKAWKARQPSGILCHRYKFIYFPIAKAAGSSMRTMIAEAEGIPISGKPHQLPFEQVPKGELKSYPDYRTVVVVRNPWSRLLACYKNKIVWQHTDEGEMVRRSALTPGFARYNRLLGRKLFYPGMPFDEFVRMVARIPDAFSDRHFRSQHKSFCHADGTPFVDCVVRMENLQEEMQAFLSSIGAESVTMKHLNKSRRSKYIEQYDDELVDIASRRYRRDIELLNYTKPRCQPSCTPVAVRA